jgi:hypothetical protein
MTTLSNAEKMPRKQGKAEYLKHLHGKRLTRDEAIRAKCYECVGGEDTSPCTIIHCALTQYCQWNLAEKKRRAEE